jgi:hypothetical protein
VSAAVAATGKAKITGQIIDRAEVGKPGEFDSMTEKELVEFIVSNIKELGFEVQLPPESDRSGAKIVRRVESLP